MPKKIAVIGGGFSGTMVIRQLIDLGFQGEITQMLAHPTSKKINFNHAKPTKTDLVSLLHFFNLKRKALSMEEFLALIDSLQPNFTQ